MRPIASSGNSSNNLVVDWLRMSPHTTSCAFQSRVFDAGQIAHWQDLNWVGQQPAGTIVDNFETRSGDVIMPGLSWSGWTPVSGTAITSPNGRYIQYRMALTTTDSMATPAVESVALSFGSGKQTQTIDFRALGDKVYGDPPFTVVATATSGLTVTFTAGGCVRHQQHVGDLDGRGELWRHSSAIWK